MTKEANENPKPKTQKTPKTPKQQKTVLHNVKIYQNQLPAKGMQQK